VNFEPGISGAQPAFPTSDTNPQARRSGVPPVPRAMQIGPHTRGFPANLAENPWRCRLIGGEAGIRNTGVTRNRYVRNGAREFEIFRVKFHQSPLRTSSSSVRLKFRR
jgi:hypothetical protein